MADRISLPSNSAELLVLNHTEIRSTMGIYQIHNGIYRCFKTRLNVKNFDKFLQILDIQPRISKVFFRSLEQFFLTVGQNNFGNKISIQSPEIHLKLNCLSPFICKTRSSFYENKVLHQLRKVS